MLRRGRIGSTNGNVEVENLLINEDDNELPVAGTAVVYTETYVTKKNVNYGFEFQFGADGEDLINCKIEIEQGNILPETEGTEDADWVVPDDADRFADAVVDDDVHIKAYCPTVTRFLRAKITGLEGNSATTVLTRFNVCTIVNL